MTTPSLTSLTIDTQLSERGVTAWVGGEIDLSNAQQLRQILVAQFVAGAVDLVVDLSEVTFIDSVGLGALIGVRREAVLHGAELTLAAPHRRVVAILRLSGLDNVFQVLHDQPQDAAQAG